VRTKSLLKTGAAVAMVSLGTACASSDDAASPGGINAAEGGAEGGKGRLQAQTAVSMDGSAVVEP
jgi:hypothetical protein